jgi:NADPH:quinone reductase-like Zn-dependent oxidoreductase
MGYTPIAIASDKSAQLAKSFGAKEVVSYVDNACAEKVKATAGKPIRKILDCITDCDSTAICYSAMGRTGGTLACLEECPESWRTRRMVKVKEVMGFQVLGVDLNLGNSSYTRPGEERLLNIGMQWAEEMEILMKEDKLRVHPLHEMDSKWENIINGLERLKKGEIRGQKLVMKLPE